MKKATEILLIISGVLSILAALGYGVSAVVFFVLSSPAFKETLIQGIQDGTVHTNYTGTPEQIAAFVQSVFLTIAIVMSCALLFAIVSSILSLKNSKDGSMVGYILVLVFSVLSGTLVGIIGSIFGLVDNPSSSKPVQ